MSIDAMKQALEALEECIGYKTSPFMTRECEAAITALRAAIEQAQEPVAWMTFNAVGDEDDIWYVNPDGKLLEGWTYKPLYTAPRQWQGLTDEEIAEVRHLYDWTAGWTFERFARQIEAKLKEKNRD